MAAVTVCSDFGAQENKVLSLFPLLPHLFAMKWWDWMPWSSFFECWVLRQLFPLSSFTFSKRLFQFSSVTQSCPTLCDPMNHSMPGLPVHHQLLDSTQTHVHWVGDAIQPSHPLSSPSPLAPNPSQHQGLFQWVNTSHEMAKVLEFQL